MKRNKLTAEEMIKKIMEDDTDFIDKEIDEISTTGAVAGYQTPNAFVNPKETEDDIVKKALKKTGSGFTQAVNKHFNTYKMWELKSLGESTYKQYVQDESKTSHAKVNTAIHEVNKKLYEIEKLVRHSVRLKNEAGIAHDSYWKSTQSKLSKVQERLIKLSTEIRKFGE